MLSRYKLSRALLDVIGKRKMTKTSQSESDRYV